MASRDLSNAATHQLSVLAERTSQIQAQIRATNAPTSDGSRTAHWVTDHPVPGSAISRLQRDTVVPFTQAATATRASGTIPENFVPGAKGTVILRIKVLARRTQLAHHDHQSDHRAIHNGNEKVEFGTRKRCLTSSSGHEHGLCPLCIVDVIVNIIEGH
jgi:hypothetical protein